VNRALVIGLGVVVTVLLVGVAVTEWSNHRVLVSIGLVVLAVAIVAASFGVLEQQRRTSFRGRVQSFVGASDEGRSPDGQREQPARPPRTAAQAAADLVAPEADIAGVTTSLGRLVLGTVALGLIVGVVVAILISSPWGLLAALVAPLVTRAVVKKRVARTRKQFEQQLPDNLDVVSSALRVGHSLVGAFAVTVEAADEPSRSELGRAIADEQLGVPLDLALQRVAVRMQNSDVDQLALVARLQRDAGTNAAEVIEQVSENVRGRMDLERLVRTLTAQGRMARWIVSLLPFFLFAAMYVLNREYLAPLWETNVGKAGIAIAIVMIASGSFIIKKIVEIEV
jgi:tight adherence protein B